MKPCTAESLHGTFNAVVTPFTADARALDLESLQKLIEFHITSGVSGLIACGSTGEGATLTDKEYLEVVTRSVLFAKGRVPVVAGVNSSSTLRAAEASSRLKDCGASGILLVSPPYNKPPQEGIYRHFEAVREASKLPIIAYNIPGRTAVNIQTSTLVRMVREGVIMGVKESSGSMDQVVELLSELRAAELLDRCAVVSGEDALVAPLMSVGGTGVIAATGNVIPDKFVALTTAARAGDFAAAGRIQCEILPTIRAMFTETNPIPVKMALALKGIIASPAVRLPLVAAQPETAARIKRALGL
jgi:4-hydroxy-tetrahydrodipicolinate synthase